MSCEKTFFDFRIEGEDERYIEESSLATKRERVKMFFFMLAP